MNLVHLTVFVVASGVTAAQAFAQDRWTEANAATPRLLPSAFPGLPRAVTQDLDARGCRVPQTHWIETPHNVIKGHFTRPDRLDWAVLCSRNDTSRILVYRAGLADTVDEVAPDADVNYLGFMGGGEVDYYRFLSVADSAQIRGALVRFGGAVPPRLDHDGIDDAFLEKGSVIWYWSSGRWWRLQGAD